MLPIQKQRFKISVLLKKEFCTCYTNLCQHRRFQKRSTSIIQFRNMGWMNVEFTEAKVRPAAG